MAEYLSPGVYVEEFDSGPVPMQGVSTSTAGFVGVAEKGPISGAPVFITNFAEFTRNFGGYLQASEFGDFRYLAHAVNHFFANGGSRAYVMRVAPSNAKVSEAVKAEGENALSIKAKNPGEWGNQVSVTFFEESKARTQVLEDLGSGTYKLKNSAGFNPGDVVKTRGLDTAEYNVVKLVDGNNVTFEKAFEAEVVDTDLLPKVMLLTCEVNVEVKTPDSKETYEFVSFNVKSPDFIEKRVSKSALIELTAEPSSEAVSPIDIIKKTFGSESDDVEVRLEGGENGTRDAITDAEFIGEDKGPGMRTGIQAFLDNKDVSIMAVPGITSANVQLALVSHCESLGSRFAVLDMPKDSRTPKELLEHRDIVDSTYCAMYHPWLKVFDPLDKKDTFIPPSGSMVGIYARSDNTRGVHKAPANEVVSNCTGLSVNYNVGEQDVLNPKGVNLIRSFPGLGIRVWGARTASSNGLWKYINIRRLFIFLEESIKANTNWVVFEPNDEGLWARVQRTIEIFLEGVWRTGAFAGGGAGDSYYVNIGPTTMTQDDIDNGRLICEIGVAPVKPAEFVIFRITQKTGE